MAESTEQPDIQGDERSSPTPKPSSAPSDTNSHALPVQQNPFYATPMAAHSATLQRALPVNTNAVEAGIPPERSTVPNFNAYTGTFLDDRERGTSTWAVISLCLSVGALVTCGLFAVGAIVCGFIALGETGRAGPRKGRGLAIAGTVIGTVELCLFAGYAAWIFRQELV